MLSARLSLLVTLVTFELTIFYYFWLHYFSASRPPRQRAPKNVTLRIFELREFNWRMLSLERINHSDHKSRPFGKVSFLTTNHGHFPSYNRYFYKRYFSTCFGFIFIFWVLFYDMQSLSEIYSPHTTILNISEEGGGEGIGEDISSLSQTKKAANISKGKKSNCEARSLF